ncbi:unnamed protein product [Ranitomeya imitator]|uniref:Uncharacterized protein n=1 Tax=Ranitomeya imitator TaxID=111125 RepID=A0ABN9L2E0_9NEOB|nr:unnamed protein product [Ranitomeya imitator]
MTQDKEMMLNRDIGFSGLGVKMTDMPSGSSDRTENKEKIILRLFPLLKIKRWLTQISTDFGDSFVKKILDKEKADIFGISSQFFSPDSYRQAKGNSKRLLPYAHTMYRSGQDGES